MCYEHLAHGASQLVKKDTRRVQWQTSVYYENSGVQYLDVAYVFTTFHLSRGICFLCAFFSGSFWGVAEKNASSPNGLVLEGTIEASLPALSPFFDFFLAFFASFSWCSLVTASPSPSSVASVFFRFFPCDAAASEEEDPLDDLTLLPVAPVVVLVLAPPIDAAPPPPPKWGAVMDSKSSLRRSMEPGSISLSGLRIEMYLPHIDGWAVKKKGGSERGNGYFDMIILS